MTKITICSNQVPILVQENREIAEASGQSAFSFDAKTVKKVVAQPSLTTIMGPCIHVGYSLSIPDVLSKAVTCVRSAGWQVKVIPENFHDAPTSTRSPKVQKVDREYEYLCMDWERDSTPLEVRDSNHTVVAYINVLGDDEGAEPWIKVKCVSQQAVKFMQDNLKEWFLLVNVSHVETNVEFHIQDYQLTATTGGDNLRTYFKLIPAGSENVAAVALCAYQSEATGFAGPTVEHIETAKEYQHQGLGIALLERIVAFYRLMFTKIVSSSKDVRLHATAVSSSDTFEWFQERGFRDDDGLGEELSISLNEVTAAAEAPYIIRQCMGLRKNGTRCSTTSEDSSTEADPLCYGASKFCLTCQQDRQA
mmetsp:Transcript_1892/g.2622  ORF Transcript_1892/g.2622 Transcript_1892/m.2622 type:complete len:364 (-) Transcript_1892:218-1309(-)|eukprot:CAMPEP_0178912276 /NCGR_PEP_ID=MMETSP0786-20121207/10170_1 /TAXON_ID=186022 /ORGANISM="Thalassionema frauenfeldii, Strain CCMP 1798" /LENGTH=363 /DNA_ID=CAMNT_0020584835 /DNA_START=225 /DNA_END=1316 /DNA_ORIENTATION=+